MTSMLTIQQQIDYWAEQSPSKIACYFTQLKQSYTYADLKKICQQYHEWFNQLGIKQGYVFAIASKNSLACAELLYAAYYSGRVVLALNLASGKRAKQYVLNHSQVDKILCSPEEHLELQDIEGIKENQFIILNSQESPLKQIECTNKNLTPAKVREQDDALLMYTSGTTGNPKGVLLSQKNIVSGGKNTAMAHELTTKDIGLCVLPLYHINAQCVSVQACLVSGSTLVLEDNFSVKNFLSTLNEYQCTWASLVPTMISYLLNHLEHLSISNDKKHAESLRFIRSASAPLPVETHQQFQDRMQIPIIETMGITETSAQILSNPMPPQKIKIGTVGLAYGNEVIILDEKNCQVAINIEGEIAIKGDNVMKGYYKNPESSQMAFNQEGWFITGDLGSIDEEGYISVTGRKKELIIKGGENISPREVDEILYCLSGIIEASAFGKACSTYGQIVEACVVLDSNCSLTEKTMLDYCAKELGAFKSPSKIHILNDLPKGPSGKIQRLKLERLLYPKQ